MRLQEAVNTGLNVLLIADLYIFSGLLIAPIESAVIPAPLNGRPGPL